MRISRSSDADIVHSASSLTWLKEDFGSVSYRFFDYLMAYKNNQLNQQANVFAGALTFV